MDVWPIENGLTELLHVPWSDRLGVGQLGGKHLQEHGGDIDIINIFPSSISLALCL